MSHPPKVLVLLDDRAGNRAQALGVAEALGWPYSTLELAYTRWVKLPNILRLYGLPGYHPDTCQALQQTQVDLVISAGRRGAPAALYLKRKGAKVCQIMGADLPGSLFDWLVLPSHDTPAEKQNIIKTLGAPHRITPASLASAHSQFIETFRPLAAPRIGVLIGGTSKHAPFTIDHARSLASALSAVQGSLLISTSRRTGDAQTAILYQLLTRPGNYFYQVGDTAPNPYQGILAWADAVIVTEDSVSMLSEATATGKPVYVYRFTEKPVFHRFQQAFIEQGMVRIFNGDMTPCSYTPYRAADRVAAVIRQHWPD